MKKMFSLLPDGLIEKMRLYTLLSKDLEGYIALPAHCHAHVVGLEQDTLRLLVNNATAATLLRYKQKALLDYINSRYNLSLQQVHVRINSSN